MCDVESFVMPDTNMQDWVFNHLPLSDVQKQHLLDTLRYERDHKNDQLTASDLLHHQQFNHDDEKEFINGAQGTGHCFETTTDSLSEQEQQSPLMLEEEKLDQPLQK